MRIPIVGQVAAGNPVEFLPIVRFRDIRAIKGARTSEQYAGIEVLGSSLLLDNIADGDYAIFRLTHEARNGDLVVARVPDGLTIKYYHPSTDEKILLSGADPAYDQLWEASEVVVLGVVVRIERDL
jgi:repressor LexA